MTVPSKMKIKPGVRVAQDHKYGYWPKIGGVVFDVDTVFDAEWKGWHWDCRADGIGRRTWKQESGGYGNGSIFVMDKDGMTYATEAECRQSAGVIEAQPEQPPEISPDKPALEQCDCTERCGDDSRIARGTARPCAFMKGWLARPQIESIEVDGCVLTIKLTKPVDQWALSCFKRSLD